MRMVYIANTHIPTEKARGIQIMKSCEAFALNGIDIELVTPRGFAIKKDPFEYYAVKKTFPIKKVFNISPAFLRTEKTIFYTRTITFAFFAALYFLFNKRNSIAYSRDWAPLLFLVLMGVRPVAEIHDYRHSKPKKIVGFILKRLRKIVVNSEGTKKAIRGLYDISENKILVAPNGIDVEFFNIKEDKFEARKKLGISFDGKIVAYVGRMDTIGEEKGVPDLIRAFNLIKGRDTRLFIVGGPGHFVEKYKKEFSDIPNVIFTGQVEYKKIPLYLRAVDVLVIPSPKSQHSKTTSPIKLFEYMTAGKPIVVSDLPSFRPYLNENNAVFFEPENINDLADKLNKILGDEEMAKKISEKSMIDAKQYSWFNRAEKIINFIT